MKKRIRAYLQEITNLYVLTIDDLDTARGVVYSWWVEFIFNGVAYNAIFVVGDGDEFPTHDLILQRLQTAS